MEAAGYGTMPNPVMQQGQCVTNCNVDTFFTQYRKSRKGTGKLDDDFIFTNSGDNESYYVVMPREYAFRLRMKADTTIGRSSAMSSLSMSPKIFTSMNNFPVVCTRDKDLFQKVKNALESHQKDSIPPLHKQHLGRLLRELVARSVIFVGVPLTRVDPSQNTSSSISVAVSGTITVHNTGGSNIDIGQKVAWDIPDIINMSDTQIRGEPRGKRLIEVVPVPENGMDMYKSNLYMDPKGILDALTYLSQANNVNFDMKTLYRSDIYNDFLAFFDESKKKLDTTSNPALYSAIKMTMGIQSRIIGTALTHSSKHGSFDILLQI